ncbi:MAG TPA: hypothetical protein VK171_16120 [Fimbriimonas sp.]|nr:hypothetical protein [Fimbriimonas sp.]
MKFFKPKVCFGFTGAEKFEVVNREYSKHIESVSSMLDPRVIELSKLGDIDDALVSKIEWLRDGRNLRLTMRCGNLQVGYYNLVLTYVNAKISDPHKIVLSKIALGTRGQGSYDYDGALEEFDVVQNGRVAHRLLFNAIDWEHPRGNGLVWFQVVASELRWKKVPRKGRRLTGVGKRFSN